MTVFVHLLWQATIVVVHISMSEVEAMSSTAIAPEVSTTESSKLREITHWIGGAKVAGGSGRFGDVFNPATGKVQAKVPLANAAELEKAVAAAKAAFPAWAAQPPLRRA